MIKNKKIVIQKVDEIISEKGSTIEWCKGILGKQLSIYYRSKGVEFAKHYHTGADPSKNPERFFLLKGKVKFIIDNDEYVIEEKHEVLIYPNVVHTAIALDDVIFVEYRATEFDPENSDTYPID